jgi:LmbE family N-acetylglucosaminyl deacetylase
VTHIVAISPHLDDAAFSIGGYIAASARAGDRVTIVTCFTGNVAQPTGFALACQLDKGLTAEVDYMALRRGEDRDACAVIGAAAVHLPFLEAPHRGYASAPALFADRRSDDGLLAPLTLALGEQIERLAPDLLLGPLAIGDHVDHWLVRDALAATGADHLLWEDWPYLRRAVAAPAETVRLRHALSEQDRAERLAMCAAYASQLSFQFGSPEDLKTAITEVAEERLHSTALHGHCHSGRSFVTEI